MEKETGVALFNKVMGLALTVPGININREDFLRDSLKNHCTAKDIETAILYSPSSVLSSAQLDRIVMHTISSAKYKVTAASTALGLPSNPFVAAGMGVADLAQYTSFCLRTAQQIAYLNGYPSLRNEKGELDDYAISVLTPMLGVMFGATMANKAIHEIAKRLSIEVVKRLPRIAATRIIGYGLIKEVAKWIGVRMSKQLLTRGVSKFIPVLGGLFSGAISYAAFGRSAERLATTLKEDRLLFKQKQTTPQYR